MPSELQAKVRADLNDARRAKDKVLVLVLGTVLAEMENKRIELRRELNDDEALDVVRKAIKRRRESIEMYLSAKREDLVARERSEAEVLERYLPPQVPEDELRAAVRAAIDGGAKQIGAVMGQVLPRFKGRADGSVISAIAREELARQG